MPNYKNEKISYAAYIKNYRRNEQAGFIKNDQRAMSFPQYVKMRERINEFGTDKEKKNVSKTLMDLQLNITKKNATKLTNEIIRKRNKEVRTLLDEERNDLKAQRLEQKRQEFPDQEIKRYRRTKAEIQADKEYFSHKETEMKKIDVTFKYSNKFQYDRKKHAPIATSEEEYTVKLDENYTNKDLMEQIQQLPPTARVPFLMKLDYTREQARDFFY